MEGIVSNWKDRIRNVAPALGRALEVAGVPGAAALGAVSKALLGKPDGSVTEVIARVNNWQPSDELALQKAEQEFSLGLLDRFTALEKVAADDRANARAREVQTKDWTPRVLALVLAAMFFSLLCVMLFHPVPAENRTVLDLMLGSLGGSFVTVVAYYYGSSVGSDVKTTILGRVAEKH